MTDGNYPLRISVTNKFGIDGNNGPNIQVKCYQFPYKKKSDDKNNLYEYRYTIEPGGTITFPLLWGEEYIELSIKEDEAFSALKNSDNYYIWAGVKTKCSFEPVQDPEREYTPSAIGKYNNTEDYYCGGTWKFKPDSKTWILRIEKYNFDPEADEIIVGPDTPG